MSPRVKRYKWSKKSNQIVLAFGIQNQPHDGFDFIKELKNNFDELKNCLDDQFSNDYEILLMEYTDKILSGDFRTDLRDLVLDFNNLQESDDSLDPPSISLPWLYAINNLVFNGSTRKILITISNGIGFNSYLTLDEFRKNVCAHIDATSIPLTDRDTQIIDPYLLCENLKNRKIEIFHIQVGNNDPETEGAIGSIIGTDHFAFAKNPQDVVGILKNIIEGEDLLNHEDVEDTKDDDCPEEVKW